MDNETPLLHGKLPLLQLPHVYAQMFVYTLYERYLEEGKTFVLKLVKALSAWYVIALGNRQNRRLKRGRSKILDGGESV